MQYGQIVFFLFIALLLYYAALIVLDIQRAKAMQAAEQDKQSEEDIDISDEAQAFKPVKVSRDETPSRTETVQNRESEIDTEGSSEDMERDSDLAYKPADSEQPYHRPGYREAIMTDGILVEDIIHEIDKLAETGTSDLGTVIFTCENAR